MAGKIRRKSKIRISVPTSSMPDIIFQLLIFFMVTTVLRQHDNLDLVLPDADMVRKLESKRNVATIWIGEGADVMIDGRRLTEINHLASIVYEKLEQNPRLIISVKADRHAQMGLVNDVQQQLRKANALRVNYSALKDVQ